MRRKQQKEYILMVETMLQIQDEISKRIRKSDYRTAKELLVSAQEGAIALGNALEQTDMDIRDVVSLLEEYCEAIYVLYSEIGSQAEGKLSADSFYTEGRERLQRIRESIKAMDCKLEVVFLPYKAAMWDCFETIWRAAAEDPSCECYVVPIPYYEIIADGKPEMHYEGELLPDYVPVTSFLSYKLSEHMPDIVYIHNPFDDFNRVTSVHPDYYSHKIKEYADKLVYVPYYLAGTKIPESHLDLPAYRNVDFIILQNESQRAQMAKYTDAHKLLVIGSPKAERMYELDRIKPSIPGEWRKAIDNKKVIMYNVSLSGFLKYGDAFFQKMRSVFALCAKRKEITLIFRPHPLLEATIKAMRPDMWQEYQQIKKRFLSSRCGILDDTPDISKTVAVCDGYMGEESTSVTKYFGVCGKPVFVLEPNALREPSLEDQQSISFYDCAMDESGIWFVAVGYNLLCHMQLASESIDIAEPIPEVKCGSVVEYQSIIMWENKILLLPLSAEGICIYHTDTGIFSKVYIKDPVKDSFSGGYIFNDRLFLVPRMYDAIVEYDLRQGTMKYHKECISNCQKATQSYDNSQPFSWWGGCQKENRLFVPLVQTNGILEFVMDTGEFHLHRIGDQNLRFWSMRTDGKDFYLCTIQDYSVVRWDYDNKISSKVKLASDSSEYPFLDIVPVQEAILVFPYQDHNIYMIDSGDSVTSITVPEGKRESDYYAKHSKYLMAKKYDEGRAIALMASGNEVQIWNQNRIEKRFPCKLPREVLSALIAKRFEKKWVQDRENLYYRSYESYSNIYDISSVTNYLDFIIASDYHIEKNSKEYGTEKCGMAIHMTVKEKGKPCGDKEMQRG